MKSIFFYPCLMSALLLSACASTAQSWQWCRNGVSTYESYESFRITTDKSGNQFTLGFNNGGDNTVFGSITVPDASHTQQLVVTKMDSAGNYQWAIGTGGSNVFPLSICADTSGNLLVLGVYDSSSLVLGSSTLSNPSGLFMYFMAKVSPSGTVLWAKNISGLLAVGSFLSTIFDGGIGADNSGNVYVSGEFNQASIAIGATTLTNHGTGTKDIFIARYDASGNPTWAKNFGGTDDDLLISSAVMTNGSSVIAANCETYPGFSIGTDSVNYLSAYLAKFDNLGNVTWAVNTTTGLGLKAIATDPNQNIYATGDITYSVTAGAYTVTDNGSQNIYIAKYNSAGSLKWAHGAGGTGADFAYGIATDHYGHSWISGGMEGIGFAYATTGYTMNFSGHVLGLAPNSYDPEFIVGYDSSGNYISSFSFSSGGDDMSCIAVDNYGDFYASGDYLNSNIVFGADSLTGEFLEQLFVAKYKYGTANGGLLESAQLSKPTPDINLFPNPASTGFTISSGCTFPALSEAVLYGVDGRLINTYPLSGTCTDISVVALPPGMYEVRINTDGKNVATKNLEIMK